MGLSRLRTTGWLMHFGENKNGKRYCNPRFVVLEGRSLSIYNEDPEQAHDEKPLFHGNMGPYTRWEELGRQVVDGHCLYGLRLYSAVNHAINGQLGAGSVEEVSKWLNALEHARDIAIQSAKDAEAREEQLVREDGIADDFEDGPRKSLSRLASIGLGVPAVFKNQAIIEGLQEAGFDIGDAFSGGDWRLLKLENGLRIYQDDSDLKSTHPVLKAVGVIEAPAENIFQLAMSLGKRTHNFDPVLRDWSSVEIIDGHTDVVHAVMEPKIFPPLLQHVTSASRGIGEETLTGRTSTVDFFGYNPAILYHSVENDKCKPGKDFVRCKEVSILSWEITPLPPHPVTNEPRSLCEHLVGIDLLGWKARFYKKFGAEAQMRLLTRVAGMREHFLANPQEAFEPTAGATVQSTVRRSSDHVSAPTTPDSSKKDPFFQMEEVYYDAEEPQDSIAGHVIKRPASFKYAAFAAIALHRTQSSLPKDGLPQLRGPPVPYAPSHFTGSVPRLSGARTKDCFSVPSGGQFKVRGKTYRKDGVKVKGGEPLLQLLAVDWFESSRRMDNVAQSPSSCMQGAEAKKMPFVFVINLQVPGSPCRSLAMYFVSDRHIASGSLLDKFANGDDNFRNRRFKLIPSIETGPFLIKRAVGSKACLLGQALTCTWHRQDNYLEMDVDIGSSSVARNIVGLVIGYVTGLVVDLAVLIQGEDEETELPEYILGAIRIQYLKVSSAVPFKHLN
ncbi:hypothetical protein KFL_003460080 [Klebsormidium nitens]|uniref:Protein ENHANCED DISEASE RESISTANCE 2 C-terminal domain-containing protein n=1 Tax=Klebsormidium nitens TaxID=105231 RepID=A0A1Y1IGR9_KLENI|nr:hypothetical protein KFL_003460080 [Klebsormidium nitens]|eukprot:GAQ87338.1 hypothetical protein KFL_003460080 [Klebsormidium nitens]